MQPMSLLITTCVLFVGSHLMLSHPLRHGLASRLGERGFQIVYSIVAIATFIMLVQAWRGMPPEPPLWAVGDILWILASIIVLFASVLFMGSLIGNPALAAPGAAAAAQGAPRGVFAITRHPMMWGFALWAVAHVMVVPTPAQIILSGTIVFLALFGSAGQDGKKARLMGDSVAALGGADELCPLCAADQRRDAMGRHDPAAACAVRRHRAVAGRDLGAWRAGLYGRGHLALGGVDGVNADTTPPISRSAAGQGHRRCSMPKNAACCGRSSNAD